MPSYIGLGLKIVSRFCINKTVYIASIIKLPFYKQYISKDEGKIVEDGTHTELCRIKKNDIIRCLIVRRNIMYNFRIGDF